MRNKNRIQYLEWFYGYDTPRMDCPGVYDLTSWTSSAALVSALDEVGIGGYANTATTLTDPGGATDYVYFQYSIADDTNIRQACLAIKKTSTAATFPAIRLTFTGGTQKEVEILFNTNSGAYAQYGANAPSYVNVVSAGKYWYIYFGAANNGLGNSSVRLFIFPARTQDLVNVSSALTNSIVVGHAGVIDV